MQSFAGIDDAGLGLHSRQALGNRVLFRVSQTGSRLGRLRGSELARLVSSRDTVDGRPDAAQRNSHSGDRLAFKKDENQGIDTAALNLVPLTDSQDLIPITEPEVRRLLFAIVWPRLTNVQKTLAWSAWRRRHQDTAKRCHYRARTPNHNARL